MRLIRLLKKDLAREMATWVSRDFISVAQARAISASYGVDYDDAQTRSGAYTVLLALGYLFLGMDNGGMATRHGNTMQKC